MIYTNSDGGSRGNPGRGAVAVIVRRDGHILTKYSGCIGENITNNVAEYEALVMALKLASKITNGELTCFLDSELVVNQLLGKYRVRNPRLLPLFLQVQRLQERFGKINYTHISRWNKFQQIVDEMLNKELDRR